MEAVILPLHKSNAFELEFACCFYCEAILPDNPKFRTLGKTSLGFRNFCKQLPKSPPEHSCYQRFKRSFSWSTSPLADVLNDVTTAIRTKAASLLSPLKYMQTVAHAMKHFVAPSVTLVLWNASTIGTLIGRPISSSYSHNVLPIPWPLTRPNRGTQEPAVFLPDCSPLNPLNRGFFFNNFFRKLW